MYSILHDRGAPFPEWADAIHDDLCVCDHVLDLGVIGDIEGKHGNVGGVWQCFLESFELLEVPATDSERELGSDGVRGQVLDDEFTLERVGLNVSGWSGEYRIRHAGLCDRRTILTCIPCRSEDEYVDFVRTHRYYWLIRREIGMCFRYFTGSKRT